MKEGVYSNGFCQVEDFPEIHSVMMAGEFLPFHATRAHSASVQSMTTQSIFMKKDYMPPPHTAAGRKKASTSWYSANVTAIVEVNLPDERNNRSKGSFEAIEAAARNTPGASILSLS